MTFAEELAQISDSMQKAAMILHESHVRLLQQKCRVAASWGSTSTIAHLSDPAFCGGVAPDFEQLAAYARQEWGMRAVAEDGYLMLSWTPTK